MQPLDHDYVEEIIDRIGALTPDSKPSQGDLTPGGMVRHLRNAVRYVIGDGPGREDLGSWFSRTIVKALVLRGLLPVSGTFDVQDPEESRDAPDPESLRVQLEEYLGLVQAGELEPARHPAYGDLTIDEWARWHVIHFEHHLRQFGV